MLQWLPYQVFVWRTNSRLSGLYCNLGDDLQVFIPSPTVSTNTPQPEGRKNGLMSGKLPETSAHAPNCSVNLFSSLFKSLSFLRTSSILSTECKTVV